MTQQTEFEKLKKVASTQMYFFSKYKLKIGATLARAIRKELDSLDNWISVESPPKKHDWYLCWSNGTERYYGFDGSWYHVSAGGSCRVNPTHYKEKSQPPKQSTKKRGGCPQD